jgi:hypothetical protein
MRRQVKVREAVWPTEHLLAKLFPKRRTSGPLFVLLEKFDKGEALSGDETREKLDFLASSGFPTLVTLCCDSRKRSLLNCLFFDPSVFCNARRWNGVLQPRRWPAGNLEIVKMVVEMILTH